MNQVLLSTRRRKEADSGFSLYNRRARKQPSGHKTTYVLKVIAILYLQRLGSSVNNLRVRLGVMSPKEKKQKDKKAQEYIYRGQHRYNSTFRHENTQIDITQLFILLNVVCNWTFFRRDIPLRLYISYLHLEVSK